MPGAWLQATTAAALQAPLPEPCIWQLNAFATRSLALRRQAGDVPLEMCASKVDRSSIVSSHHRGSRSPALPPARTGHRDYCLMAWSLVCGRPRSGQGKNPARPDAQDRVNTSAAYGFVFDVCGLEIDPNTGAVVVDRYITAHDASRLLNPALADGQIRGAFTQGLGAALLEEFRYGAGGSFQSGTLADYLMPTACETPDPVIVHPETPSPFTPLGAKGLGEGNNMSTPACIANAFSDALRPLGDVEDEASADTCSCS